jgi:RimJ/RimL family protein N-acetyltransferase
VAANPDVTWIVRGNRIGLTAPRREEFLARWELHNDPELGMLYGLPSLPSSPLAPTLPPYSREQHEALWECIASRSVLAFDARQVSDGRFIAEAYLTRLSWPHGSAELSLAVVDPADRQQRFALEALRLVCAYAFDVVGVNRIVLRALALNEPLVRGFERHAETVGARKVGVEREAVWAFGGYQDVVVIEILKREFPPHPATAHLRRGSPETPR